MDMGEQVTEKGERFPQIYQKNPCGIHRNVL